MTGFVYHTLIPHPSSPCVLLQQDGERWRLPQIQSQIHYSDAAELIRGFAARELGIQVIVLRWVTYCYDPAADRLDFWYVLENESGPEIKPGCRWFTADDLDRVALAPDHLSPIQDWLQEPAHPAPHPLRSPWAMPGWFAEAEAWIAAHLDRLGWAIDGPIEQVKVWQRSCVLRIPAAGQHLYFKAVPSGLRIELALLLELAACCPSYDRLVLASDMARGWSLMRDMGGPSLWDVPELARWEEAVRAYARLQIDFLSRTGALRELGCMDRPIERLPEFTADLVACGACVQPGVPGALSDEERAHLQRILPAIHDDCRRLAAFGLPQAIEHGDLNPKNVILSRGKYFYFDWSDASLSHPFFSLRALLGFIERAGADPTLARTRLRDAYLKEWAAYSSPAELVAAFELADRLAPLHMALTYHLQISPHLEVASEWVGTEGLFLRWLLDAYAQD